MIIRTARAVLLPLTILLAAPVAFAQTPTPAPPEKAVVQVVQQLFDGMAARDATALRGLILPDAIFVSIRDDGDPAAPRVTTAAAFLDSIGKGTSRILERMWSPEVKVHGRLATVWAPYDFWSDGTFSHCGIDQFDLVKTADGWRIASIVYTAQRTGCTLSPLGPPK